MNGRAGEWVFLAAGAALLAVSRPAAADHAHHSPANVVLAALSGATVDGDTPDGKPYRIVYGADGSARIVLEGKTETGAWAVDAGGHYCETWPTAFGGKKRCSGAEVVDGVVILRGPFQTTRTIVPKPAER